MTTTDDIDTEIVAGTEPRVAGSVVPRMSARAKLVLGVLCAAQFMVALDFSILNVALPTLGQQLGISQANLQWAVTAFALPSGGLLLFFGRLADHVGRRRVFLAGLGLFALGSLVATAAPDAAVFLGSRSVQGVGAAMIVPAGMALLTTSFAEGPQRNRALGVSGVLMTLGFTVGVVVGGVLTQTLGWRSTMALNVIAAVLVLLAAPRLLGESRDGAHRRRLDVPGAVTVTGGLLAVILAVSLAARDGWTRPLVPTVLLAGLALLACFVVIETRTEMPLVAFRVLRRPSVAWGNLGGLTTFSMMSSVIFLATLYLQQSRGMSPMDSGLVFGVLGLGAAGGGTMAPRLVGRLGSQRVLVGGLVTQGVLTAVLALVGASGGVVLILVAGGVAAVGHACAIISYGITATSGLPNEEQGLATGLTTTAQQVAMTIGVPVLSAVAASRAGSLRAAGQSLAQATLAGVRLGFVVDGLVVVLVAVVLAVSLRRRTSD